MKKFVLYFMATMIITSCANNNGKKTDENGAADVEKFNYKVDRLQILKYYVIKYRDLNR